MKALLLGLAVLAGAPLLVWGWLMLSRDPLPGIQLEGRPLTEERATRLRREASLWQAEMVAVQVGDQAVRRSRAQLGARRDLARLKRRVRQTGRSGNPWYDLQDAWRALEGRLDLAWPIEIDAGALSAFVRELERDFYRPAVGGVTDGQGFTLDGRAGQRLDPGMTELALRDALLEGRASASLRLVPIAVPPALLGIPDGMEEEEEVQATQAAHNPSQPAPQRPDLAAVLPTAWLPVIDSPLTSCPSPC